jgi:hypothetical protein
LTSILSATEKDLTMKLANLSSLKRGVLGAFIQDEPAPPPSNTGFIAALISVVIIATVTAVGTQLTKTFTAVSTALSGANN